MTDDLAAAPGVAAQPVGYAGMSDGELAARLADIAGRLLLQLQGAGIFPRDVLGAIGDHTANAFLTHALRDGRSGDGLLSEESSDDGARLAMSRVWVIDPVDGTREFSEGRTDWAVHVALVTDGVASLGAVALPGLDLVLRSDRPGLLPARSGPIRMVVSRTRPGRYSAGIAALLDARLLPMGSAGAKAMAVVRGEADVYLHSGGQYEWDSAAPVAVATAHGLHCSRLDGSPLRYNNADLSVPDLLICRPEFTGQVFAALRECA
jgi:3'(2'), 5'-bisphosphate nucleotidase